MDIRNFCIIAHVDHGKSTLADRMLEITGTVDRRVKRKQLLDTMELERERGITIKLQPVRMNFGGIELNLIDTPGHTDFRYEVSRSLAACEGAILLVDASQGVQAQTLATLYAALEHDLVIIPVLNKIDLPAADVTRVSREVMKLLGCNAEDVLAISARDGTGVKDVLDTVVHKIPGPATDHSARGSRALVFDAVADSYRGVVAYVRMIDGEWRKGQKAVFLGSQKDVLIVEVGCFKPSYAASEKISAGEIGYIVTGLKNLADVRVGDTIASDIHLHPLPGYQVIKPMIFAGLYPHNADDFEQVRSSLEKLSLNDAALSIEPEQNAALGNGFRCGFLGLLHMDIVQERLEREYYSEIVVTAPGVTYEVRLQRGHSAPVMRANPAKGRRDVVYISNPSDFPDRTRIKEIREPWVRLEVVAGASEIGGVMQLVSDRRGTYLSHEYINKDRVIMCFEIPLQGVVMNFFDKLQSLTSGYGSMSYEPIGFRHGDLVKLDILLLGEPIDALSTIVDRSEAHSAGSAICKKLKKIIPRRQFQIPIQAAVGGKILARETVSAVRKDVTAKLYGGDRTRKDKLLKKQKKGKARLKAMGKILLPQEAFLSVIKR